MRTTLTLDADVVAQAKRNAAKLKKSFKEVVNDALRVGLDETLKVKIPKPYKTVPQPLGLRKGLSYDNLGELLAVLEGEDYK